MGRYTIIAEIDEHLRQVLADGLVPELLPDKNAVGLCSPDEKGDLTVKIGMMKISVNLKDLMLINDGTKKKKPQKSAKYGSLYKAKAMNISPSFNVQGETLDEAVMDVDKYLDDAYMAGLPQVTVIHGRGTGTLRRGLQQLFRKHAHVDSFAPGSFYEGGEGVTVVDLKK